MSDVTRSARALAAAKVAHPVFVAQGWTWHAGSRAHVPTLEEIATCIEGLIANVEDGGSRQVHTGRLGVIADGPAGSEIVLELD